MTAEELLAQEKIAMGVDDLELIAEETFDVPELAEPIVMIVYRHRQVHKRGNLTPRTLTSIRVAVKGPEHYGSHIAGSVWA